MKAQQQIVQLINEIDKIVEDKYFEDELYQKDYEEILNAFSYKLNEIFEDGLNEEILIMINKLEYKNIFKILNGERYINNKIRIQIKEYLDENDDLYLDYELVKNNISENYKLAKYVKDKSQLVDLVQYNEKVLLLMEGKYLTKELIKEQINKSDFVSKIFLGIYGVNNQIYRYSDFYSDIQDIDEVIFNQLKDTLKDDPLLYIHSSKIIKENKKIQELVVSVEKRMESYIK